MTQLQLPESFLKTMQKLLGEEYESFLEGFNEGRQFGLRVNTSKMESEEFARIAPFHLSKISMRKKMPRQSIRFMRQGFITCRNRAP